MNQEKHSQQVGFFPNALSVGIFLLIMMGMFFGFTRFYPDLARQYFLQNGKKPPEQVDTAKNLAPFVRGVLSGVKTSQQVSQRKQEPLNINAVEGYQFGIRTALLTSKNWYNIDRQLFRVRGMEYGVSNALQMSSTQQGRYTLENQIKLVQHIQTALNVNLEELLTQNEGNRRRVLQNYLENLKDLADESALEVAQMQQTIDQAQSEMEQYLQISDQFSDAYVQETETFQTENIDRNLEQYIQARKQAEEARANIAATSEVLKRLQPLSLRLPQVIFAIEANFEALSLGVKITPTPGVNLPVIEQ